MICEQPVSSSPGYLARVDVYDHVVHSVSVQVHDVHLEQVSLILPSSLISPLTLLFLFSSMSWVNMASNTVERPARIFLWHLGHNKWIC